MLSAFNDYGFMFVKKVLFWLSSWGSAFKIILHSRLLTEDQKFNVTTIMNPIMRVYCHMFDDACPIFDPENS